MLAAKNGAPIIFIDPSVPTLPKPVASYFTKLYTGNMKPNLVAFGGSGAITDEVMKTSTNLISGVAKEDSIYSVDDISVTVTQNDSYSLPATVLAKLYNGDVVDVAVKWAPSTIDTSKIGINTYEGKIDKYSKKINLKVQISNWSGQNPYFIATQVNQKINDTGRCYLDGWPNRISPLQTIVNQDGTISVLNTTTDQSIVTVYEYTQNAKYVKSINLAAEFPKVGAFTKDNEGNYYVIFGKDVSEGAFNDNSIVLTLN